VLPPRRGGILPRPARPRIILLARQRQSAAEAGCVSYACVCDCTVAAGRISRSC
jgi:hypothetical protein